MAQLKEKNKMISDDEADFINKCGIIWRKSVAGEKVVVVTDEEIDTSTFFHPYSAIVQKGVDNNLIEIIMVADVKEQHLEMTIIEF